jgi:hypothetical protein
MTDSIIQYMIADDDTEDFFISQFEHGEITDEIRMTRDVALQLAWKILNNYTL